MEKLYRIQVDIAPALPPALNGDPQVLATERHYLTFKFLKNIEYCVMFAQEVRACAKNERTRGTGSRVRGLLEATGFLRCVRNPSEPL